MEETKKYLEALVLYRNYLFALQTREEYGNKYGDTEEIIDYYKKKLKKILNIDTL